MSKPTQSDLHERTKAEFEETQAALKEIWEQCRPVFERLQIARNQARFQIFRNHLTRAFREL